MSAGLGTRIVMRRGRYLPCSFRLERAAVDLWGCRNIGTSRPKARYRVNAAVASIQHRRGARLPVP